MRRRRNQFTGLWIFFGMLFVVALLFVAYEMQQISADRSKLTKTNTTERRPTTQSRPRKFAPRRVPEPEAEPEPSPKKAEQTEFVADPPKLIRPKGRMASATEIRDWQAFVLPGGETLTKKLLDDLYSKYHACPTVDGQYPEYTWRWIDESNTVLGIFQFDRNGAFIAAGATYAPDGTLVRATFFRDHRRHGPTVVWDEDRVVYVAHFKVGKKDGVACIFRDNLPRLAQVWKRDAIVSEHLLDYVEEDLVPVGIGNAFADEADDLRKQAIMLDDVIEKEDAFVGDIFREQYHDAVKANRRQNVTAIAPQRAAAGQARRSAQNDLNASGLHGLWQSGLRRMGR